MAEQFNNKVVVETMSKDKPNTGMRLTLEEFGVSASDTAALQKAVTELGLARQKTSSVVAAGE